MTSGLTFGKKLRRLRQNNELTQEQLALIFKNTQSSIVRYEKGHGVPDLDTLKLIADYFNISIDYLVDRSPLKENATDIERIINETINELEAENTLMFMKNGKLDDEMSRLLKAAIKSSITLINNLKK